jgi:eukaryotic-like serine/threonine-protein kinase
VRLVMALTSDPGSFSRLKSAPDRVVEPRVDTPPDEFGGLSWAGVNFEQPALLTDPLRRSRVRAAALFLTITLTALLAWRASTVGGRLLILQAVVVFGLGLALAVLWSSLTLSARSVKILEFLVFGLTAAFLSARQYQQMTIWAAQGDEASLVWAVKTTMFGTMLLAFAYGMLIPNTWREAARVVMAIVALPVLTELLLLWTHDSAYRVALRYASWVRVGEDGLTMTIAAGLSVYGTYVINALRCEAFEARQLNQYKLGRRLGTGGMGEVYLAEHRLLKRPCALKLIRPETAGDPAALGRFEREVRVTARLSHPNTVEVYDYGRTDGGTFFYVMEYLRGLSLDDLVKRHGPMSPARVIHLLRQVCGALAEAHAAGLVHRDIKPANVFACFRGGRHDVVKLLDFGLVEFDVPEARPTFGTRANGVRRVRGTPRYMAPEQILGAPGLDHRSDLYALGGVAYTLLTGQPPFEGVDSTRVMEAQVRAPILPLRELRPEVPEDLERVVLRCLEKSPDARYADAGHLADAFAACDAANRWDEIRAALWWHEHEPAAITPLD